jgi:outer membrane protein insertion porin family
LSGGWGGGRVVGTLGVSFNNFSASNVFNGKAWRPLPAGDGQTLSLRAQSNGVYYQSYNASFIEPWLGGKKPNSFSITMFHSVQTNGEKKSSETRQDIKTTGIAIGLGKRLKVPDDYFTLYQEISQQHYDLNNFQRYIISSGNSNNLSYKVILSRNSIDQPIYPQSGSQISGTLQLTPPFSKFRKDSLGNEPNYSVLSNQEKYKWIEYHKWKFTTSWFTRLAGKLVLNTKAGFGFLGLYNRGLGMAPFERFYMGGDGLTGYDPFDGREVIALRGYDNGTLSPSTGATSIVKYTMELRYPFSLNPSATIYGLTFIEGGNSWNNIRQFNPFAVNRSGGVGVRVFLPMFGLLGLDYAWRFDEVPGRKTAPSQFHFTIGANIGDL